MPEEIETLPKELELKPPPAALAPRPDKFLYRAVVLFLGFALLLTVIGGIYLAGFADTAIPDGIIALGSAAIGALAGLLAESPSSKS